VGPKLAERIVRELKDKIGGVGIGVAGAVPMASGGILADSVSALAGLDFKPGEAGAAVVRAKAELGDGATLDALVRLALRKAGR
jgi:holliday junction DNA helicase RuvA